MEQFASQVRTLVGSYPLRAASISPTSLHRHVAARLWGLSLVAHALALDFRPLNIHFIDNTDPEGIDRILAD